MSCPSSRQRGAALVIALFMLIAVLLVGVSAAQMAVMAEKSARSERDRHIAFQAAEAALLDAEKDIEGGLDPASKRAALFSSDSALGFEPGCGRGSANANLGLCLRAGAGAAPVWQAIDFADGGAASARSVAYGAFTGLAMKTGQGSLPAKPPRYIVELMPFNYMGEDAGAKLSYFYRVTAIGFGARETTQVVLQTFYRKLPGSAP
jgi:type IV pilus assembly protein PilX